MQANDQRLKEILEEVFLVDDDTYKDEYGPDEIEGWDSLATVSMAVAVHETFDHHMKPDEVAEIRTIGDIKAFLRRNGVEI